MNGSLLSELKEQLADRYDVDRELGRGGMAVVLLAHDRRHDRHVAIKVLHGEIGAALGADRFRREIQVAAKLAHPGVVPVLDSGALVAGSDGTPLLWYAMPLVASGSLRDRLERERQLPLDAAVRIARDVAETLDYAHRQGIVHRDVKPENILLQDNRALLADFGIARSIDRLTGERLTASGVSLGTPAYMSPEQASGDSVIDGRADVFALGAVLYECIAGEPPFTGPNASAILARMMTSQPRAIAPIRPNAASIEPLLAKALARTPADRFATAGEFAAALDQLSFGQIPPQPRPAAATRKSRRPLALGLAVLVAVAAAGLWSVRGAGTPAADTPVRIAVLPFRTAGDSARAYFTQGMAAAMRSKLASIPGIEVIAAASVEAASRLDDPVATARELGAAYALTGTVAWDSVGGGRILVRPELQAARDGRVALSWPSPLEAPTRDVFDVERKIAERIAQSLNVTLGAAVQAQLATRFGDNSAAYELLLRADDAPNATVEHELLERAVALDSLLAPAWTRLAFAAISHYVNFGDEKDVAMADAYSARALGIAPAYAESHLARGMYHRSMTLQHDSTLIHLRRARELAPGSADVSHFVASGLQIAGRMDEALVEARRGAGLDPRSSQPASRVTRLLLWLKRPKEAWENHLSVLELPPGLVTSASRADGPQVRLAQGDVAAARALVSDIGDKEVRIRLAAFLIAQLFFPQVLSDTLLTQTCQSDPYWFSDAPWAHSLVCAEAAHKARRFGVVKAQADSAVRLLRIAVRQNPRSARNWERLARSLLLSGDTVQAMIVADSAFAVRRMSQDAFFGAYNTLEYAMVTALAGDAGRAVPALDELLQKPSPVTREWLRADPTFDRIRADPRFTALVK